MPWNGAGTYAPPAASFPEVNGTTIDAGRFNPTILDLATGITAALAKNGENVPTANLPMGGFKHTGALAGTGIGEYLGFGAAGTITTATITTLNVSGNTSLGDAAADTLSVSGSVIKNAGGNWNFPVPSANATATFNLITATGALTITDGTTACSFQQSVSTVFGNTSNHPLSFLTNNLTRWTIAATGGHSIPAPTSGTALSLTAATSSTGQQITAEATYNSETVVNLYLKSGAGATNSGLLLGTDKAANIAFIQSIEPSTSYGSKALWINPNGANTLIGTVGAQATFGAGGGLTIPVGGITVTGACVLTGAVSGVTTLSMSGALSGATTGTFSGAVTASNIVATSSGTYTPTLTATANVSAAVANVCQWLRVGDVVTVSGSCTIDPTTASTSTTLGISLPVASNFATQTQCAGTAGRTTAGSNLAGYFVANTGGDLAALTFFCDGDAANATWTFHFTYLIV